MLQTRLKTLLLITSSFFFFNVSAQYNLDWATNIIGTGGSNYGVSVATDALGNVYELGRFNGTSDFDPGADSSFLTSNGLTDMYVRKLSPTGDYIWAISIGGTDYDNGKEITVDNFGDIIVVGYFKDTVDFDPGPGVLNLTPNTFTGYSDGFIQKLDSDGNLLWVRQIGASQTDYIHGVDTDSLGNVYSTGSFRNTVDFDPGPGVYNLTAISASAFVQKLDVNGNFVWAKMMAGSSGCSAQAVNADAYGNVYVTGGFQGVVDFDPGPGVFNLTSLGSFDVYVQKLDSSGNWFWAKGMGNIGYDFGVSITTDLAGDIIVSGPFEDTVDFDPGVGVLNLESHGGKDGFIQKLDAAGNLLWATSLGDVDNDQVSSVITDNSNNIISTGQFEGTVDFDPGPGVYNLTSSGWSNNIFVQAQSPSGDLLWVEKFGGSSGASGYEVVLDGNENILVSGTYLGWITFSLGNGSQSLDSYASGNAYVTKLRKCQPTASTDVHLSCNSFNWIDGNTYTSSNNTATWMLSNADGCDSLVTLDLTINYSNTGTDVQTACDSLIWIDGNTYTTSNNTATWTVNNIAGCDSLVTLDLTVIYSTTETDVQTACDTYIWIDGNTYTSSNNTATWTLTNAVGCDSVVTLDLAISYSSTATDVQSACFTYDWIDGNTYTTSNNSATWTLTNMAGCDSTVTLDLTINYSNTGTDVQTACDSYDWIDGNTYTSSNNSATWTLTNVGGCDSVVTLDLTVNYSSIGTTDTQSACGSYAWINGSTYTFSTNAPTWTLTNIAGCDSVITLNLTIAPIPDVSVGQSGAILTATQVGAAYQWLDCDDNNSIIGGETNQAFTPTAIIGNYAVEIDLNGCIDTSTCYLIDYTGLSDLYKDKLSLSPNPADDQITIIGLNEVSGLQGIEVISLSGKLEFKVDGYDGQLNVSELVSGIYFVRVTHMRGIETLRFIKK